MWNSSLNLLECLKTEPCKTCAVLHQNTVGDHMNLPERPRKLGIGRRHFSLSFLCFPV